MREYQELPLSPTQQRVWFLEQLSPGGTQYNIFLGYELSGPLDRDALRRALGALADRHDALRMTFTSEDGIPAVRLAGTPTTVPLEYTDLAAAGNGGVPAGHARTEDTRTEDAPAADAPTDDAPTDDALTGFASRWSQRPFDLARDPLMRAHLVRLGPDRHLLMLSFHHIIIDGWSTMIVDVEIGVLYTAEVTGRPAGPPPSAAGYADYARWRNELSRSPETERHLAYWREKLAGAPPQVTLPADRPRPRVQRFRGADLFRSLPADVAAGVDELARANRATPFMVGLTALGVLLARYARTGDLVVGVAEAGRSRPEFVSTVGFFVQTLPVRMNVSGDPAFLTALADVRESLFGAYEHDLLSFDVIVDRLRLERDLSYTPLVQVLFHLLDLPPIGSTARWHDLGMTRWGEGVTQGSTRFDLEIQLSANGGDLFGLLVSYNVDLFDQDTVQDFLETYVSLLRAVCADPRLPVSELTARVAGPPGETRVSVRDEDGVPLPRGALGRLWLDDTGVDTGRLARLRADGTLEDHGPCEGELVVHGGRVPARVVEDALAADPAVASARVRDDPSGSGLVATLVPVPGRGLPRIAELRRRLRGRLPAFLIPGSFRWEHESPPGEERADAGGAPTGDRARGPGGPEDPAPPPREPVVIVVPRSDLRDGS
ncbi:condensation domain-containing protein [Actinomadura roseirufa]|uniref:condensation domain-containing protein n=1 Tax=Actinomadura roseirufa TaxID=2094049 RepID=UPI001040EFEB|nr:condensation domain-containing protein [Actinomadura roseirufa]